MANFKLTYQKAYQSYKNLDIARSRCPYGAKNEFESIRSILEDNGVFLIEEIDKTVLPPNPTVNYLISVVSCTCLKYENLRLGVRIR